MGFRDWLSSFVSLGSVDLRHAPGASTAPQGEVAQADPSRLWGDDIETYNPSMLVTRKGYEIFERMRLDDQVKAAMKLRKLSMISTGWDIRSPEGESEDWPVRRFVEWNLREVIEGKLEKAIENILTSKEFGFSLTEKIWQPLQGGEWDGLVALHALKLRKPHDFVFVTDEYGNLKRIEQLQNTGNKRLDPRKFVLHVNEKEWGNYYGRSELEAAYRPWWLKDNMYRWFGMGMERFGVPFIYGVYDPNRVPANMKDKLKDILKNLQAGSAAIFPAQDGTDGVQIHTLQMAEAMADAFIAGFDKLDKDIARALLMPSLLGFSSDSEQGSFARAKVHFDVFMLVTQMDREDIATNVMNEQVIKPLVDVNFGPQEVYPYFQFGPLTDGVRTDILEQWNQLLKTGAVQKRVNDELHIRSMLEFPEPDSEGRDLAPDNDPTEDQPSDDDPDDDPGGGNREPSQPDDDVEMAQHGDHVHLQTSRTPEGPERRVDFQQIERDLSRLERDALVAMRGAVLETHKKAVSFVEKTGVTAAKVNGFQARGRRKFNDALQGLMLSSFETGRRDLRNEVGKAVGREFAQAPNYVPTDAVKFMRAKAVEVSGANYAEIEREIKRVMQTSIAGGLTTQETIKRLRDTLKPWIGDPNLDPDVVRPHRLENIARTEATAAVNRGRLVMARDKEIADAMQGMRYSAIIDTRTTQICQFLDGKTFRLDDPELDRLTPPNHFQCRSLLVPVTVADDVLEADDYIGPSGVGRARELATEGFA